MRYYIDTCVWIDFVENVDYADNLLFKILQQEAQIFVSELVFSEFVKHQSFSNIKMIFSTLKSKNLIVYIKATKVQEYEAISLSNKRNIPFGDALHAVLARDNDAILLTRDKHFMNLKDICKIELF
jgi:predicted nucleic acid-binding protein